MQPEAGVVDQQVHRSLGVGEAGLDEGQLVCGRPGRAGSTSTSTPYVDRSSLGDLLQPRAVAGDEHQVVALGGQLLGELVADAGGGAGDQRGRPRSRIGVSDMWPANQVSAANRASRVRHDGRSMTTTLAIANQKGGVAKTTTVASLGAALAELGHRVLLVDLDPQACLTFSLGIDPEDLELSVHHVLTKGTRPGRGDHRDRRRCRPAAGHHRAGSRRGRPADPHRSRARRSRRRSRTLEEDLADESTTGCCSTARRRSACSPSPR